MQTSETLNRDIPLSERLAIAIRTGNYEGIEQVSAYAACISPLLKALGWRAYQRELLEALPHFAFELDLIDLRNLLVTLGYESDERYTSIRHVSEDLLPCLYVGEQGEVLVVIEREDDKISYFDANTHQYHTRKVDSKRGHVYLFTDMHPTHAVPTEEQISEEWFSRLLNRFRKLVKHLFAMTFILNVIALAVPIFIMVVYDNVIGARATDSLPYLIGGLSVALGIELVLRIARSKTIGMVAGRLDYIIGVESLKRLMYLPPQMTEGASVSSQLSRLKQFESIRDFFTGNTASIIIELPFVFFFILVLALLGGEIAFVPLGVIVIYVLFALFWFPGLNKKLTHAGKARSARQRMLMETFTAIRELKALGGERTWHELFREISGEAMSAAYKTATSHAVVNAIAQSLMSIAGILVLAIGTFKVMEDEMSIGALIAIMALLWRVLSPLQGACLATLQIDQVIQSIKQLNQLMRLKVEATSNKAGLLMPKIDGRVTLDRVSFRYAPTQDPALLNVSFDIQPKEFVAVVGGNGSGKSTVLKLIAGMYRAQGGTLYIDQTDVRQLNAIDLRRLNAYVPQKPKLFHGSIAQNLRLTNPLASDDDIADAANQAGVLNGINKLAKGFNTVIGDNTISRLPTGLVHGICLARAYVRKAPILLLDEPGASLDMSSDKNLMSQLQELRGKQTIVMVSHRPSHIKMADKVIVLSKGMVAYVGPPDEALKYLVGGQ